MRGSCIGDVHLETYLTGCLDIGWDEDVCARWDRGQNHAFGVNSSGKEAPFQTFLPPAVDWCPSNNFKECDDIPSGWFDVGGHISVRRFRWSQLSLAVYATPNLELPNCLVNIVVNSGEEVRNDATQTYLFPHLLNRIFYFFECIIPDLQLLITIQWISIIPRDWARVKEVGTLGKETSFHTSVPGPLPHQLLIMMINQEISKRVTMLSLQLGSLIRSIRTWTALSRIFARICGWKEVGKLGFFLDASFQASSPRASPLITIPTKQILRHWNETHGRTYMPRDVGSHSPLLSRSAALEKRLFGCIFTRPHLSPHLTFEPEEKRIGSSDLIATRWCYRWYAEFVVISPQLW